jgi:hypothetical protein
VQHTTDELVEELTAAAGGDNADEDDLVAVRASCSFDRGKAEVSAAGADSEAFTGSDFRTSSMGSG